MTIAAFVLAGGGSRRFGRDKARADVEGAPLLVRNATELARRYGEVRVVSAPGRTYDDLGFETIHDAPHVADRGPLAGIHTALTNCSAEMVAIAACDLVGLDADWYDVLEKASGRTAAAFHDGRWHPVVAGYHRDLLPEIERRLTAGELAVRDLLDAVGTQVPPPAGFAALRSVDRPRDVLSPAHDEHTRHVTVTRRGGSTAADEVAVEEPLEIRLAFEHRGMRAQRNIAITMRTPGHDAELAVGFLFGEGIVRGAADVVEVAHCGTDEEPNPNVVKVVLADGVNPELSRLQRNFYTTSSCGVCGKSSLEALDVSGFSEVQSDLVIADTLVASLGEQARNAQAAFARTGGLHAASLFDASGQLVATREDVGRHNALDKLIGRTVLDGFGSLSQHIVFLSGRASFELLQKSLSADVPIVCAVGAPSSLAVDLAERFGITLLGFVRDERFNVYAHPRRICFG